MLIISINGDRNIYDELSENGGKNLQTVLDQEQYNRLNELKVKVSFFNNHSDKFVDSIERHTINRKEEYKNKINSLKEEIKEKLEIMKKMLRKNKI